MHTFMLAALLLAMPAVHAAEQATGQAEYESPWLYVNVSLASDYLANGLAYTDHAAVFGASLRSGPASGWFAAADLYAFEADGPALPSDDTISAHLALGYRERFAKQWHWQLAIDQHRLDVGRYATDSTGARFRIDHATYYLEARYSPREFIFIPSVNRYYDYETADLLLGTQQALAGSWRWHAGLGQRRVSRVDFDYIYGSLGIQTQWRDTTLDLSWHHVTDDVSRLYPGDFSRNRLVFRLIHPFRLD